MPSIFLNNQKRPVSNLICIGRNYVDHAEELNNEVPSEPLVFFKPTSALTDEATPITLPTYSNNVHFEGELLLYIGKAGSNIPRDEAIDYIAGIGLGLDLTARDIQDQEKAKGHPWSRSKCFPQAGAVSQFINADAIDNLENCTYSLDLNGKRAQTGETRLMIFPISDIIHYLSSTFGLSEGDIIFTGTPAGVAQVNSGDQLTLSLADQLNATFTIA